MDIVRAFRIDWPFRGHYSIDVDGVYRPTSRTEFDHHIETWRNKIDAEKIKRENALGVEIDKALYS